MEETKEGDTNFPSAPGDDESSSSKEFVSDKIKFDAPTLVSFDQFKDHGEDGEVSFIREPESKKDFFAFIKGKIDSDDGFLEDNKEWIWPANADSDDDVLCRANNATSAAAFTNTGGLIGKMVRPGEVLFCTNRNQQKVFGPGLHTFIGSLTHADGDPINIYEQTFVKRKIITIVTLQPNQVAIALNNQKPVVLLPGRHCYHDAKFQLTREDIFTIKGTSSPIYHHTITLVRIGDWELGLGYLEGRAVLLKPGLHISRDTSFQYSRTYDTRQLSNNSGSVTHDNIAVVKVDQKDFGLAVMNGEPVFLLPGLHIKDEPSFAFLGLVNQTTPYIHHQNLHIIQVQSNQLGLGWQGNTPMLIEPGIWYKNSPLFRFDGFRLASEQTIQHGSITRYFVKHGDIGFAWRDGKVEELDPGIRIVDDPNFQFIATYDRSEPVIRFGNVAYVTTQEAHCRPVYVNGKLRILVAGSEKFNEPNLVVNDSFSTGEIIFPLEQVKVLTRDRTPMLVTGQVNYQIVRPKDLIFNLGYANLQSSLEQSIHAILRHAFSITDLSTISPDNKAIKALEAAVMEEAGAGDDSEGDEDAPKNPHSLRRDAENNEGQHFRGSMVHDVHTELVRLTKSWGIDVKDLAIADIQFEDKAVADKLANATSNTRTAEAEFDLTQAQTRIRLEKAQADAQEQLIVQTNGAKIKKIDAENNSLTKLIQERSLAEAEALKRKQEMDTEADLVMTRTNAKAEEMLRLAEARAKELRFIAEAERDADLLRAEGQKALAEAQIVQYSNANVLQLEMMRLYVEASKYLATAPVPAVLLQQNMGGSSGDEGGTGDMLNMFRKQGKNLLGAAMGGSGVESQKSKKST